MPIYRDIYFLSKNFDHSEYQTGMDTSACEHGCDEMKSLSQSVAFFLLSVIMQKITYFSIFYFFLTLLLSLNEHSNNFEKENKKKLSH